MFQCKFYTVTPFYRSIVGEDGGLGHDAEHQKRQFSGGWTDVIWVMAQARCLVSAIHTPLPHDVKVKRCNSVQLTPKHNGVTV